MAPRVADRHSVKFYETDESLFTTVGAFLSQGLVDRHPAIIIATPPHADGILADLAQRSIDVGLARRRGWLIVLDAEDTLASFMVNGAPDAAAFARDVGRMVGSMVRARKGEAVVRAYGEMVDVLWRQHRREAAVRLEILWNALAAAHSFALMCGYAMGDFYKETELFEQVCRQHTHVIPPFDVPPGSLDN